MLTSLVFLRQANVKKSEKLAKKLTLIKKFFTSSERYDENFNEVFRKNLTYDNIKSQQKSGLQPLSRKHNFRENTGGGGVTSLFRVKC